MNLTSIKLENFRNHERLDLKLAPITAIIGVNGVGKSNIIEAIALLSSCRSYREEDKRNMVMEGKTFARISSGELEIFLQREPTALLKAKIRGVFKRHSEFIGTLRSVVFSPETIDLIYGSPKARRRFIDILISQKDREYLRNLMAYEKVRKERNSLLQRVAERLAEPSELDFWDEEFIKYGVQIIEKRLETILGLNALLSKNYRCISGNNGDLAEIIYHESTGDRRLPQRIAADRQKEIWAKRSLFGPHRDDIRFLLNNHEAATYASRGESKSLVLSLKIAETEILADSDQEKPILLLDDLFSEFDMIRREHLMQFATKYQTIITTTDQALFGGEFQKLIDFVELEKSDG